MESYRFTEEAEDTLILDVKEVLTPHMLEKLVMRRKDEYGFMQLCVIKGVENFATISPYKMAFKIAALYCEDDNEVYRIRQEILNILNLSEGIDLDWAEESMNTNYSDYIDKKIEKHALRKP